jgi:hypothetical protein
MIRTWINIIRRRPFETTAECRHHGLLRRMTIVVALLNEVSETPSSQATNVAMMLVVGLAILTILLAIAQTVAAHESIMSRSATMTLRLSITLLPGAAHATLTNPRP